MSRGSLRRAGWWAALLAVLGFRAALPALTITEIMYQPPAAEPDLQFVEVFNDTGTAVDLSGYFFSKGLQFVFPEGTVLGGKSYLVVCSDVEAVKARYGILNAIGDWTGSLDPGGEEVEIVNLSAGEEVKVSYNDRGRWPSAPKGTGHTLSLREPHLDPDDGVNWTPSRELGGSPGRANFSGSSPTVEETDIIPLQAVWRYQKGTPQLAPPIPAWRTLGFNDSGWLSGATGIGYGDNDDQTVLADMMNGYLSIAARRTFTLTADDVARIQELVFEIRYDDGFAAYVNGNEVGRNFLGNPGEDAPFDLPAGLHEADPGSEEEYVVPKAFLRAGLNVLAVQVHNNLPESSDLSFIPRLFSRRELAAGKLVLNEHLGRTTGERWIELHNPGPTPLEAAGYHLSDDAGRLDKFTIPAGPPIPAGGFLVLTETQTGLALGSEDVAVFLTLPDRSAVADARVFENDGPPERIGMSDARYPDGAAQWVFAGPPTPGAPNALQVEADLVMNEIMYHPLESRHSPTGPFETRPGEYIEIHNRGARTIPLRGFALTRGVDYRFPDDAAIGPGGYVVVAQDPAYMAAAYGLAGVLGPWTGNLQNDGEAIRLEDPAGNTVDEVRYSEGGDWSELADGRGSSLELVDPRQDNSAGGAWEASDESGKAPWTQLSYTGSYTAFGESTFRFTPMEEGSFLIDDVEIMRGVQNHVQNGGFEAGTAPWVMEGSLVHTRRIDTEAHSGSACLEVIATRGGDMRVNRLVVPTFPAMPNGTYTVRFWARWLHGGNLILAHGFDNALARTLWLPVPRDLGTPGRENGATARLRVSTGAVNLGPVISAVEHRPPVPGGGQPVSVGASVVDADGVASVQVRYRLGGRGDGIFTPVAMAPDASGRYSATLPGFPAGTVVVFYLEASDARGATRRYPIDAPARTLLYQASGPAGSPLLVYRLSLDNENRTELEGRQLHSDDPVFGSFVFEESEVYYNVGLHYHGSPWNRPGQPRMFKLFFPGDRPLKGVKKFNISRYGSVQNEAMAYYTVGRTGRPDAPAPRSEYRYVRWLLNGADQGNMSHVEVVDRAYMARWFPLDKDGLILRANGKITFRLDESWNLSRWAAFQYLGPDKEAYRWNWDLHSRTLEDDWAPVISLMRTMDPGQTPTNAAFDLAAKDILDVEQMARMFAVRVLNDDWDTVGIGNGQNTYIYYASNEGRWKYVPWDMDHTFGNVAASLSPTADPGITRLLARPEFRRIYLQAIQESLDRTWNTPRLSLVLDPTEAAGPVNAAGIKSFVSGRTTSARAALGSQSVFGIRTNGGRDLVVGTDSTIIEGNAPLAMRTILLNGEPLPEMTWSQIQVWRTPVALESGLNRLEFFGYDRAGTLLGRVTINVTSTYQWNAPSIQSIEPASGPAAGGTAVVIRGADFHQGVKVFFGAAEALPVTLVGPAEIQVATPPGAGAVEVRVQNVDGRSAATPAGFIFQGPKFIRGDAGGDGAAGLNDVMLVLEYLFRRGTLGCLEAADANDDGLLDVTDAVRLLFFLYRGGAPLPQPYPELGADPTPDTLGCASG